MKLSIVTLVGAILAGSLAQAATVRASTGARAEVAGSAASNFQCLVSGLEATGYRIDFMGGYRRHGSVRHSLHPAGLALDINQTARGRVTRALPRNANQIASGCGLFHGALWANQDQGHFQVGGTASGRSRHQYASRRTRIAAPSQPSFSWPWDSL